MVLFYNCAMSPPTSTTENKSDDVGAFNRHRHGMCVGIVDEVYATSNDVSTQHQISRDKSPVSADDISTSSCKFRAYINEQQHSVLSHYLYFIDRILYLA